MYIEGKPRYVLPGPISTEEIVISYSLWLMPPSQGTKRLDWHIIHALIALIRNILSK